MVYTGLKNFQCILQDFIFPRRYVPIKYLFNTIQIIILNPEWSLEGGRTAEVRKQISLIW